MPIQEVGCSLYIEPGGEEFNSLHDRNGRGWHHARDYSVTGADCQPAVASSASQAAYHLNDIPKDDLNKTILPKTNSFEYESSTSMLLLCLPQFIADNITFQNTLLWPGIGRCFDSSQSMKLISTRCTGFHSGTPFVS